MSLLGEDQTVSYPHVQLIFCSLAARTRDLRAIAAIFGAENLVSVCSLLGPLRLHSPSFLPLRKAPHEIRQIWKTGSQRGVAGTVSCHGEGGEEVGDAAGYAKGYG